MKQILLYALIFPYYFVAGQTLVFSPDEVRTDVDESEFETVAHAFIRNTGTDSVTMRWIRLVDGISEGWQSAICDVNLCYGPMVDSTPSEFLLTIGPGDSTMLDVHLRPFGKEGSAQIRVRAEDVSDTSNVAEGLFIFNEISSTRDIARVNNINLFPNPTQSYFELTASDDLDKLFIYSVLGNKMREYRIVPNARYYVSDLPNGMYLVKVMNKANKLVKTLRLSKN